MRKLTVISFLTLDGVLQGPGGADEDKEGGFKHCGWQLPYFDDSDTGMGDIVKKADGMLLGRKTYDIFAQYWPAADGKSITIHPLALGKISSS